MQLKKQQSDLTERAKTILVNLETSQKQQIEKLIRVWPPPSKN